jgi:hypothetical protein
MIIVKHRVNLTTELQTVPNNFGVEVDVRSFNGEIILQHNPLEEGEKFVDWITHFNHELLILNVKEEGLEVKLISILRDYNINSFFFLDQSFPSLYRMSQQSPQIVSIRVSDFEPISTSILLSPGWIWLDSHSGNWEYLIECMHRLKETKIKTCLVSPELQRQDSSGERMMLKSMIREKSLEFDAVCTKFPDYWL